VHGLEAQLYLSTCYMLNKVLYVLNMVLNTNCSEWHNNDAEMVCSRLCIFPKNQKVSCWEVGGGGVGGDMAPH
jgi:hypothetical protein